MERAEVHRVAIALLCCGRSHLVTFGLDHAGESVCLVLAWISVAMVGDGGLVMEGVEDREWCSSANDWDYCCWETRSALS